MNPMGSGNPPGKQSRTVETMTEETTSFLKKSTYRTGMDVGSSPKVSTVGEPTSKMSTLEAYSNKESSI